MAQLYQINQTLLRQDAGRGLAATPRSPRQNKIVKGSTGVIHTIVTMLLGHSNRWFAERYNVNNAWNFNGTNRNLNNNNVNNTNQVGAIANLLEKVITQR